MAVKPPKAKAHAHTAKTAPQQWECPIDLERLPTQKAFVMNMLDTCQMYGGGVCNGKSAGLITKAFFLSYMFPGSVGLIARWDGKELRQTTMAEFRNMIPKAMIERSNDQMGELVLKKKYGGSMLYYGDLKETRAINNYNLTWAAVDQAEEIDDERWDLLLTRTRRKTPIMLDSGPMKWPNGEPAYVPNFNFGAFNPEGTGSYIWRFFHPDSPERRPGYRLYEATSYDGLAAGLITQENIDKLLSAFSPQARKRYLEGCWDVFSGRIYPGFDTTLHVVPQIPLQPHWKVYETIDHGLTNPTAVGWWAVDEDDNWYLLDEHYEGGGKPVQYHAAIIKQKRQRWEKNFCGLTYLDSACWAATQSVGGHVFSIADEYAKHGIYAIPGAKDWDTAFSRITGHLNMDAEHRNPFTGVSGAPRLWVHESCRQTIREFNGYAWKKNRGAILKNMPDEPQDRNDHAMDALAYLAVSIHTTPKVPTVVAPIDPLVRWRKAREKYNPLMEKPRTHGWMGY